MIGDIDRFIADVRAGYATGLKPITSCYSYDNDGVWYGCAVGAASIAGVPNDPMAFAEHYGAYNSGAAWSGATDGFDGTAMRYPDNEIYVAWYAAGAKLRAEFNPITL